MKTRRVVVTGIGAVVPKAIGTKMFWDRLLTGRSGIDIVRSIDTSKLKCHIGGEVGPIEPGRYFEANAKIQQRFGKNAVFGLVASRMSLDDAGLSVDDNLRSELSLLFGATGSSFDIMARHIPRSGPVPSFIPSAPANSVSHAVASYFGIGTRSLTASTACASGLDAMALAFERIRSGTEEIILTGSGDSAISFHPFADFEACNMLSLRNEAPEQASRPFDLHRDGGLASEGAGICIFESLERATARKARIYAEVIGAGTSSDAPNSEHGSGLAISMKQAMDDAGLSPSRVQYINAHGPSDKAMDRVETDVIKDVFRAKAKDLMVSSIKGVTGNPLSAGGALQLAATALALHHRVIPPTANYEFPDPQCDLDYVPRQRHVAVNFALVNSHGVGGGNVTLAIKRCDL